MDKLKIAGPVIIMVIAGIIGFYIGALVNDMFGGAVLFSLISGIACIIYAIYDQENTDKK